ncbi:Uncharacterized protein APZ42_023693 [Daphnia magna]|uniref:Uncharacterized protein n=1 Tax=Daphnia magna TaxID=35525 RepID=A0A162DGQ2_9CRUS|nr:Uncharacterized protein APZ42_023693 [Daphnia magna]
MGRGLLSLQADGPPTRFFVRPTSCLRFLNSCHRRSQEPASFEAITVDYGRCLAGCEAAASPRLFGRAKLGVLYRWQKKKKEALHHTNRHHHHRHHN